MGFLDLHGPPTIETLPRILQTLPLEVQRIYPDSFRARKGLLYGMIRTGRGKKLLVFGKKEDLRKDPFVGEVFEDSPSVKICEQSLENVPVLMELFPFTRPVPVLGAKATIGTGDRLGLATPGHIRAIRKFNVRPVLAQQSSRENGQTGRTFEAVIADAAWSVFQEGYEEGYGADADHLKSLDEVKQALRSGITMITLDPTDLLAIETLSLPTRIIERRFKEVIDPGDADVLFHLFLDKEFRFSGERGDLSIRFSEEEVKRYALYFHPALHFTEEAYQLIERHTGKRPLIDLEWSIDESPLTTSPAAHLFLVVALHHRGVRISSFAPRLVGDFQKGIDYLGDLSAFRDLLYQHHLISQHYGTYKLSLHSGSDKFSILPILGQTTQGRFHLKTSGTSWLEAVRLISQRDPSLFREMYLNALSGFPGASSQYPSTPELPDLPHPDSLADSDLPFLLDHPPLRQLFHITYGLLLKSQLRDRIYQRTFQDEEAYASLLEEHIGNHLFHLGAERRETG
ncbi:MAG: tagaturonate epimerase family protein [Desulfobacterota bacterium]|nr:tagaturonate epimerase family protein [Thermodesulfobacteriota bacterium]